MIHSRAKGLILALVSILFVASFSSKPALSQIDTGGIAGVVKDTSGAVVSDAEITLKNDLTGISSNSKSTSVGTYAFTGVNPGTYTLTISLTGFETRIVHGIEVHVQQTAAIDVSLAPGNVQQEVTVTAASPLLQTADASLGQTIGHKIINDLPLETRNWGSLGQLAAGVATAPIGQNGGTPENAFYSVNGVQLYQNDFRLDGINNNIEFFGGSSVGTDATITPPPDAVQEFKLQSGDYSAEFGHSTGGVINAVLRSGTNELHGDLWEYVRNDAFNANDYFSDQEGKPKAEYRQNQFGGTVGGPAFLPKLYDGRNKTFFFFDYQGTRIVTPAQATSTVPTVGMSSSGFSNLQDLITYNSGTSVDGLGRKFSHGTVLDPATTRQVQPGQVDPVTGLQNTASSAVFVRDPFYSGGSVAGIKDFTSLAGQLNQIPGNRLDPNAVKLLDLYPTPTTLGKLSNNFLNNPKSSTTINAYDLRIDENIGSKDTIFGVWDKSYYTAFAPGALPGQNDQNDAFPSYAIAGGYTHVFTPTFSNELHVGFGHSDKDQRLATENTNGIPAQYGIQGIPQVAGNGGLPTFNISGLTGLGPTDDRPTIQSVWDLEVTDNVTKELGHHTFKTGVQVDDLEGDIMQPPAPRGLFTFNGQFTDIPNQNQSLNGIADLLLTPTASTVGGVNGVGGLQSLSGSNFAGTDYHRYYTGAYFQDDWRVTPSLTLNLGLRWDYFTPYSETNGRQANFLPVGGNGPTGTLLISQEGCNVPRSATFNALLSASNISVDCVSSKTLGDAQKTNFGPRLGFAYRVTPSFVVRGGYGISYGALGNLGYGGTLGTNYPFIYTITKNAPNSQAPLQLSNGQTATIENTFTTINLSDPTQVNGAGVNLYGRQFNYQTPYVQTFNLTTQDQFTRHDSVQVAYVGTVGRHLDVLGVNNSPSQILPVGTNISQIPSASNGNQSFVPFPNFAPNAIYETTNAASSYSSMQSTYQHQTSFGLELLANYTWSKCFSNQRTQGTATSAYRAQWLPGFGISGDYGLCDTDATNVAHISGTYALPIGRQRQFFGSANRVTDAFIGGWAANYIYTYQSGQPLTISCATATTSDFGCFAPVATGQSLYAPSRNPTQWLNPNAFIQPAAATQIGQSDISVLGGLPQQARGPSWYNLDASVFKNFEIKDSTSLQFRAESFNTLNNPQFAQPGNLNYLNPKDFSSITALRNTPRLLQLALKLSF
ncbi:archaellum component FlaG (FlaF/FlaG flagellin family) [Silvibacterium bohemicum]|uniref:Archaellum component FlaG (FlaF/FlaG flagellin family) n=1 Tax=Silvibacterium bohemicum TaxID=1577686 RepID=A0A841JNW4_9BACT|nr:TonB-dependent receptor [Silvibacterium bohemicum]MBB6142840.1 archaellum component FlaG (FlaF/FlaG flagellin family) [Silvibacterium bohemicum]